MNIFRELPPLENPLVLNHIFQRCSVDDLKSCRLVSRFWRDCSHLAWKSIAIAKINIRKSDSMGRTIANLQVFSQNYDEGQGQMPISIAPFTNFHLKFEDSIWFYDFWGSSVKVLKLDLINFESRNGFVHVIFNSCQNLEELCLSGIKFNAEKVVDEIKWNDVNETKIKSLTLKLTEFGWNSDSWMEFLSRAPYLQDIILEGYSPGTISAQFFQSVKQIRDNDPNKLNLKHVDIQGLFDVSEDILQILSDTKISLKCLSLGPKFLREFGNSVPEILYKNSSSLRKVIIERNMDAVFSNDFNLFLESQPNLENLRELSVFYYKNINLPLNKVLMLMPNLKKLELMSFYAEYLGVENLDVSQFNGMPLRWCTDLSLLVNDLTCKNIDCLVKWMPNLKKLNIRGLSNETFSKVCDGWPNLVKLDAIDCTVTDSGITGMDAKHVAKINETGQEGVWTSIPAPKANISRLKELETLSLRADPFGKLDADLGYCSLAFGIELLPKLKHLLLKNFKFQEPARAIWKKISTKFPWPEEEEEEEEEM